MRQLLRSVFPAVALVAAVSAHAQPAPGVPLDELLATEISTASKYEQTVAQAPASVTIVTAEEIRRYGWETLADVMQMVRGFYTSYDRNYHYVGVRGFSRPTDYNNRLLLLLNGQPLNETVFGSAPFGTDLAIDLDVLERIEIVRGPGSSLYGTGAMFSVVNLITRSGASLDGVSASASGGSGGKLRGAVYGGTGEIAGADVAAAAVVSRTSGRDLLVPELSDTPARGLDFDDYHGALATVRIGGLSILANTVSRRKGMPTGSFGVDFPHPDSYTVDERALGEIRYERELGPRRKIALRGFASQYHYDGVYPYDDVRWLDRGDGRWIGGEVRARFDVRANHRLTAGAEYTNVREAGYNFVPEMSAGGLFPPGEAGVSFDMPHHVLSIYAEDEYQPLETLSITAGVRYDDYSHLRKSAISPRAAVIWDPRRGTTVKLVYGRAFRAPSTYELAYVDPQGGVQGNSALDVEKIDTWEAIVEHRLTGDVYAVVDVFEYRMRGLIDPRESAGIVQFENVGAARARGIEAELQARFDRLWVHGSVTFEDAVQRGDRDTRLTNSPRHLVRFGISSPFADRWTGAFEALYESERLTIHGTRTDAFLLANGRLAFALSDRLELSVAVRNLFDREYATPAGFEHVQHAIPQDGSTFTFKLHYGL